MIPRLAPLLTLAVAALVTGCDSIVEPQPLRRLPLTPVSVSTPVGYNEPVTIAFSILAYCWERASLVVRVDRRIGEIGISATTTGVRHRDIGCVDEPDWSIRDTVRLQPYWGPDSVIIRFHLPGSTDSLRVLQRPAAP